MNTTRQNKMARLLQKELADMFITEGHQWVDAGGMITVTVVRISPDLGLAKVYLSIFKAADKAALVATINRHSHEWRKKLGARIRHQVRRIPELVFYLDDSLDYAENIDHLLSGPLPEN